jgi:two-component system chemotaxis response regulator CheY
MLIDVGFEVFEAADGLDALRRLKEIGQADVLLVDWNMPEMNGYELVCALRGDPRYNEVPLMMVTSETELAQMAKALEAGANEYVMKPFTKEVITEKLPCWESYGKNSR